MSNEKILWANRLEDYKSSNLSKQAWCKKNNITKSTFYKWYNLLNKEKENIEKINWVKLEVDKVAKPEELSSIELNIGKVNVKINKQFDKRLLIDVVKVLGEIC